MTFVDGQFAVITDTLFPEVLERGKVSVKIEIMMCVWHARVCVVKIFPFTHTSGKEGVGRVGAL